MALELFPPTRASLKLHVARPNDQTSIWIRAGDAIMAIDGRRPTGWQQGPEGWQQVVWKRLPAGPDACLELITCVCKTKCSMARCECFKYDLRCTPSSAGHAGVDGANAAESRVAET